MFIRITYVLLYIGALTAIKGDKTEEEWRTAIQQLIEDFDMAYSSRDKEGLHALLTEDFHRLPPGLQEIYTDHVDLKNMPKGQYKIEVTCLRWFCGQAAVFEYNSVLDDSPNRIIHGDGIASVVENNSTLKFSSLIWNFFGLITRGNEPLQCR